MDGKTWWGGWKRTPHGKQEAYAIDRRKEWEGESKKQRGTSRDSGSNASNLLRQYRVANSHGSQRDADRRVRQDRVPDGGLATDENGAHLRPPSPPAA